MPVTIIGNYPSIQRYVSGLFSLDYAMGSRGELGIPMRTVMELYGYPNAGKSTLAYFLAGRVTGKGDVALCDLENADRTYIEAAMKHASLDGNVYIMDATDEKKRPRPHEDMLGEMCAKLRDEHTGAAILDSVGAIQPIAEAEGEFGEAFMGKRAKLVAQVSRAVTNIVRNKDREGLAIVINHVHQVLGGKGHVTAGGDTLKYMAAMRVMIWPHTTYTVSDDDSTPIGFYVRGKVEKLRYGGKGREFGYYIVPQYGVHTGASALMDCLDFGLAESKTVVKMDGKSYGFLKKDLLSYAYTGKQRKFDPFVEKLEEYKNSILNDPSFEEEVEKEKKHAKAKE